MGLDLMLLLCLLVPFAILVALLGMERVERWVTPDPEESVAPTPAGHGADRAASVD